jgi:hypothetical protein
VFSFCCNKEGDGNSTFVAFYFCFVVAKKAMAAELLSPSFFAFVAMKKAMATKLPLPSCVLVFLQ